MRISSDRLKWVGAWLLQLPAYMILSFVMRWIIGALYDVLVRAGAQLPPHFLLQHLLWVGVVDGFLAGLVGYSLLSAVLLLPKKRGALVEPVRRPQAWTWVLPTCWMLSGVIAWCMSSAHQSVLAASSGVSLSGVVDTFFGRACTLGNSTSASDLVNNCMRQITFTHFWLGTMGYSVSAFVPSAWFQHLRRAPAPSDFPSGDQHYEKIES